MEETKTLAAFCDETQFESLPQPVIVAAKQAILDTLGCALGSHTEDSQRALLINSVVDAFKSDGASTVIQRQMKTSAAVAAMANGIAAHSIDFDDLNAGALTHTSCVVLPAAMAAAEESQSSGRQLITSFVLGYEVAVRIGTAVMPSHYEHWHSTATNGTFGAAVAAGKHYGLNRDQFVNALGFSGTQAAGLLAYLDFGDFTKNFNPGKAAFNGVLAALLARAGATAPPNILEGARGYVNAFSTAPLPERLSSGLQKDAVVWRILRNIPKLFPSLSASHTAIEATSTLIAEHDLTPSRIDKIRVFTFETAVTNFSNYVVNNAMAARLSVPYCVAACAATGDVTLASFRKDTFDSMSVRTMLGRVEVLEDPELSKLYPASLPARVEITARDGTVFTCQRLDPKGSPGNPVSPGEMTEKFCKLVTPVVGDGRAKAIVDMIDALESVDDVCALGDLLR